MRSGFKLIPYVVLAGKARPNFEIVSVKAIADFPINLPIFSNMLKTPQILSRDAVHVLVQDAMGRRAASIAVRLR